MKFCFKPIPMVWMKVKISFGVSRKKCTSSLPNTLVLRIQKHSFPRLHLRQGLLDCNKFYGITYSCVGVSICTTINDIFQTRIILSKFYFWAQKKKDARCITFLFWKPAYREICKSRKMSKCACTDGHFLFRFRFLTSDYENCKFGQHLWYLTSFLRQNRGYNASFIYIWTFCYTICLVKMLEGPLSGK